MPPSESATRRRGKLVKDRREQQVDGRELRVHPEEGDGHGKVGIGCDGGSAAAAEVQAERHVGGLGGGEEGVPVVAVERGQSEPVRCLGEGDRLGALGGCALHLGDRCRHVPEGNHHHGDEAIRRRRAPLVEDEVVPGHHARSGELLVLGREERPAGEPGKRWEAHLGVDAVEVHVGQAGSDVVATREHLVEADRVDAEVLGFLPRHGIEPNGGDGAALEAPRLRPTVELDDVRSSLEVLGGQAIEPHPLVFDHMVID